MNKKKDKTTCGPPGLPWFFFMNCFLPLAALHLSLLCAMFREVEEVSIKDMRMKPTSPTQIGKIVMSMPDPELTASQLDSFFAPPLPIEEMIQCFNDFLDKFDMETLFQTSKFFLSTKDIMSVIQELHIWELLANPIGVDMFDSLIQCPEKRRKYKPIFHYFENHIEEIHSEAGQAFLKIWDLCSYGEIGFKYCLEWDLPNLFPYVAQCTALNKPSLHFIRPSPDSTEKPAPYTFLSRHHIFRLFSKYHGEIPEDHRPSKFFNWLFQDTSIKWTADLLILVADFKALKLAGFFNFPTYEEIKKTLSQHYKQVKYMVTSGEFNEATIEPLKMRYDEVGSYYRNLLKEPRKLCKLVPHFSRKNSSKG